MKLKEVSEKLDQIFEANLTLVDDLQGLQVGDLEQKVSKILVALEITSKVVDQAIALKAQLIVVHHPFIYKKINCVVNDNYRINLLRRLIKNDIAVYIAHSNIDMSQSGINNHLAKKIGLKNIKSLFNDFPGISGEFSESKSAEQLAKLLKEKLELDFVKIAGTREKIKTIALIAGDGDEKVIELAKSYDCVLTGDVYYHTAVDIIEEKQMVIDIGHIVEAQIVEIFAKKIAEQIEQIEIFSSEKEKRFIIK